MTMTDLTDVVRGRVWVAGDEGFDQARQPWNLAIEQPVAAVIEVADAEDVVALVRHAASAGLTVTTQANGHGATGRTAGTVLLRTRRLDSVAIDVPGRRARIGAGVASGRLQAAAAEHGLTGLPGSSPVVSVAGVALGGGLSWFGRAFGWVSDAVVSLDVVDATGERRQVSASSDPDLFWALRGGGGEFAVVTALELALEPAPQLYGGRVLWDAAHASAVIAAYREITAGAPPALTVWLDLLHFPGAAPMVAVDATYLGPAGEARELLAPLDRIAGPIADSRRVMRVDELGPITAEPTDPSAGLSHAELLTRLDDEVVATLLRSPIAPLLSVQIRQLGGAFAQESASPHGPLTEPFALYLFGLAADPAAVLAKQAELAGSLPVSGRKPVTFLNSRESLADAFGPVALERLRVLKKERDPRSVLRGHFPVEG
jgi:hypothetical protein